MKWASCWWGIQILAENEKDKKLLKQLKASLPEKKEYQLKELSDCGWWQVLVKAMVIRDYGEWFQLLSKNR